MAAVIRMHRVLKSFLSRFASGIRFSSCPSRSFRLPSHIDGRHQSSFLKLLLTLAGASVLEGQFGDGGLVELAFAEFDESQVLIVGRLS